MLWAGSSSVYYHDLPAQVAAVLSKATGKTHLAEIAGRSGDSIQVYLKPGTFRPEYGLPEGVSFLDKIRDGKYDYVVLQVVTHFLMGAKGGELEEAVEAYVKAIRTAGGEPVVYEMGWGLEALNDEGRTRMRALAKRLRVRLYAPVSTAWKLLREARPDVELHNLPDRTHPGTLGHFLNVAVISATILGKPVEVPRTFRWWPTLSEEEKAEARKRLEEHGSKDAYHASLPNFLQVRSAAAKEYTMDGALAQQMEAIAWKALGTAQ
jgi:hypothetical protein